MPVVEVRPTNRVKKQSAFLRDFRRNITSEMGEDGMIERLLELLGVSTGWCVEFGAGDGYASSNSWNLIANYGWKAVLIEGLESRYAALSSRHAERPGVHCLKKLVTPDGENRLDVLLAGTGAPRVIDLMSIDIDGLDWHVWNSLENFRPRIVLVEFNPSIPNDVVFIQDADPSVNQGASLRAFVELAKRKGYELAGTTDYNAFFVDGEIFSKLGIEDNAIDAMHDPGDNLTHLFQLFDGSLCVAGCNRLMWHNVEFDSQDIQVLPRSMRHYRG
jgi:hypothetical protein